MKFAKPRCRKLKREIRMSGRGGFPSVWHVEIKCRLDTLHPGPCDFTRGKRITSEAS